MVPLDRLVPDQKVITSAKLSQEEEDEIVQTLSRNKDIFPWSAFNLKGVSRDIIQHYLDINPKIRPRKQKQRKMSKERIIAAKVEVQRLLDRNVIREVMYSEWLANIVLVPKKMAK